MLPGLVMVPDPLHLLTGHIQQLSLSAHVPVGPESEFHLHWATHATVGSPQDPGMFYLTQSWSGAVG